MGRPPISTLYETILFITAAVVLLCLILEFFDRKKIALAVACVLGFAGMRLGLIYEMKEAMEGNGDTMVTLQAVLRSNFWLGTHVIIINLGYASGLLASGLSMVYIGSRLPHGWRADNEMERSITRMVYGIVCFTLLFSLVGTVLGGVWANDSWGRFWGWDPKENGALMIVLWSLVILHARMGGYIKRIGLHAASVMLGLITVFSWWGVNLLDIGLHSYGRTSGVAEILAKVYWFGAAFIVAAGALWLVEYSVRKDRLERKSAAEN
jgi:ABC-type transport system involved in cytochrome c biogenesis permease subunit